MGLQKNRMASPGDKTTALVSKFSSQASWSMSLIKHPSYAWGTSSISQHYSYLYTIMSSVFGGRWAISLMLRGYWPLWWWSASSPEPKRYFGGSVGVQKHLFPRNYLFYWVSYHITILPILWWWKGGGALLWVGAPFVCSLTFPHAMAEAYLMHC